MFEGFFQKSETLVTFSIVCIFKLFLRTDSQTVERFRPQAENMVQMRIASDFIQSLARQRNNIYVEAFGTFEMK